MSDAVMITMYCDCDMQNWKTK